MKELQEALASARKSAYLVVGLTGRESAPCNRYDNAIEAALNSLRSDGWVLRPKSDQIAPARDNKMMLLWLHQCGSIVRRSDSPAGTHCPVCDPDGEREPGSYRQLFAGADDRYAALLTAARAVIAAGHLPESDDTARGEAHSALAEAVRAIDGDAPAEPTSRRKEWGDQDLARGELADGSARQQPAHWPVGIVKREIA